MGRPRGTGFVSTPTSPRVIRYPYKADTAASRRRIVAVDRPEPPSEMRTTFSDPGRGRRCAITNAITSAGRISKGSFPTTVKNVFRSCAYARTVFGRARLAANSKNSSTKP